MVCTYIFFLPYISYITYHFHTSILFRNLYVLPLNKEVIIISENTAEQFACLNLFLVDCRSKKISNKTHTYLICFNLILHCIYRDVEGTTYLNICFYHTLIVEFKHETVFVMEEFEHGEIIFAQIYHYVCLLCKFSFEHT